EVLHREADLLQKRFPKLAVVPVDADFTRPFELPPEMAALPRAGFFPGSTIGNFEPHEACTFLRNASKVLGRGAIFVIGVDLVKDRAVLNAAYNDAEGVTAKFNLNVLARINRELGANFNLKCFEHHAFFNRERSRIEMHLASTKRQKVKIGGETIEFRSGETIHTENSYKYTTKSFGAVARGSGWAVHTVWTDAAKYFAVYALMQQADAGHPWAATPMPICEADPWRLQYFRDVECPPDLNIPTEDFDAWAWYPGERWVYDKLAVALSQGLEAAPHGVMPPRFPVFSKPIVNLKGMGIDSRAIRSA